jgi:hypothetical protein
MKTKEEIIASLIIELENKIAGLEVDVRYYGQEWDERALDRAEAQLEILKVILKS